MTNRELVLNMFAEISTKDISDVTDPQTMDEHADVARRRGGVAREARENLELETGKSVVTSFNAKGIKRKIDKN